MRVLVIEDNAVLTLTLELMLKKMGFNDIRKAYSAEEALSVIDEFKPELMLVDINLDSDLTGIDVVKIAQDRHNFTVLYTTANSDKYHRELAEHTPHEAYLIKPLSYRILSSALEKVTMKLAV